MEHTNLLLMEELKSASSMSRWRWTNTGKYNSHTWSHVEFCSSRTSSGEFFFWTHFRLSLCKLHQLRMRSYGRHTPNSRANGYSFSLAANSELKWPRLKDLGANCGFSGCWLAINCAFQHTAVMVIACLILIWEWSGISNDQSVQARYIIYCKLYKYFCVHSLLNISSLFSRPPWPLYRFLDTSCCR